MIENRCRGRNGSRGDTRPLGQTYASWEASLALPGVYGLIFGRTLLYPQDGDVAQAVDIAAALVQDR